MHLIAESWPSANPNNPRDGSEAGSKQSCHAANLSNIHAGLYFTTRGHVPARSLRSHQKTDELWLLERVHSLNQPPTHPPTQLLPASVLEEVLLWLGAHTQTVRPTGHAAGEENTSASKDQRRESWRVYKDQSESLHIIPRASKGSRPLLGKELNFEMSLHISQLLSWFA